MVQKVGLFEYLAVSAVDCEPRLSTEITESDGDEYDAPNDFGQASASCLSDFFATTIETRNDDDTTDDDAGLGGLSVPRWEDSTVRTSFSYDPYDVDSDLLGTPTFGDPTSFTKVEGETYDDDGSLEGLTFPQ